MPAGLRTTAPVFFSIVQAFKTEPHLHLLSFIHRPLCHLLLPNYLSATELLFSLLSIIGALANQSRTRD